MKVRDKMKTGIVHLCEHCSKKLCNLRGYWKFDKFVIDAGLKVIMSRVEIRYSCRNKLCNLFLNSKLLLACDLSVFYSFTTND